MYTQQAMPGTSWKFQAMQVASSDEPTLNQCIQKRTNMLLMLAFARKVPEKSLHYIITICWNAIMCGRQGLPVTLMYSPLN